MMKFRRLLTTAAAAAALMTAGIAGAADASSLSVARASAPAGGSRFIEPGSTATIISIGILAAFTIIVLLTTDGDGGEGGNSPNSP